MLKTMVWNINLWIEKVIIKHIKGGILCTDYTKMKTSLYFGILTAAFMQRGA